MSNANIVSDATASLHSRCNKSGPWYYSGSVYVFLDNGSSFIAAYKSTYTESGGFGGFSEQNAAGHPVFTSITTNQGLFTAQDPNSPNLIHVVAYGNDGTSTYVEYSRFNCSTNTWAEIDTVAVAGFTLGAGAGSAMIVVRSDGDKIIIYQGPAEKVHGTNYGRIFYTVHQGTAWGDASGAIDAGGTTSYQNPTIAIDDADTTHIAFENGTAWRYQTLNSSNSLGTEQAMGGNAQLWVFPQLRYYNNAGTHEVYFSFRHTSGGAYYIPIVSGTPGTQVQMTATNQYSQGATWETTHDMCIRLSNGHKYLAFAQQTNQDDYYVTNASGSWSSDTVVSGTGQTIQDLDAEIIVTDESATVLAVVFQDTAGAQNEIWTITIEAGSSSTPQAAAGSLTPSGTLVKSINKVVAGSLTPTGIPTKLTSKSFSGSLTPTGALVAIKKVFQSISGNIIPTGTLVIKTLKTVAGSITPVGALTKSTAKLVSGSITPDGTLIRKTLKSLIGSLTPSGTIAAVKAVQQAVSGVLTPAGTLTIKTLKAVSGTITPNGDLVRKTLKQVAGSLTPSGVLNAVKSGVVQQAVSGVLTPAGALIIKTLKTVSGSLTPTGDANKATSKSFSGSLAPTGGINKKTLKQVVGSLTPIGILTTLQLKSKAIVGSLTPAGTLSIKILKQVGGALTPSGTINKTISKSFSGTLSAAGNLIPYFGGTVTIANIAIIDSKTHIISQTQAAHYAIAIIVSTSELVAIVDSKAYSISTTESVSEQETIVLVHGNLS